MQHQFLQMQAQVKDLKDEVENRIGNDDDEEEDTACGNQRGVASQASQQNEPPLKSPHIHHEPKLMPLSPGDDTEHYLTFERMAAV